VQRFTAGDKIVVGQSLKEVDGRAVGENGFVMIRTEAETKSKILRQIAILRRLRHMDEGSALVHAIVTLLGYFLAFAASQSF
jgi:hypothetical protein